MANNTIKPEDLAALGLAILPASGLQKESSSAKHVSGNQSLQSENTSDTSLITEPVPNSRANSGVSPSYASSERSERAKGNDPTTQDSQSLQSTLQDTPHTITQEEWPISEDGKPIYPGAYRDKEDDKPLREDGYQCINFPRPDILAIYFDPFLRDGTVELHPWQIEVSEHLSAVKPTAQHPHKFCLCAANGSGKDAYVLAPFVIWFALTKIKSLIIITSSSGVQLTAQTENYIRSLAEKVNLKLGQPVFKIRQRYIKCLLSGSEIRLFATDEAGKAEGYHPLEPVAEMAIIVNEGKSVSEEIHGALKRCTGFNYWLEVSTPGEPFGFFYRAYTTWMHTKRVTAYDCPHISRSEIESDRIELGEHSALFRSMRLALFTSLGGTVIIGADLMEQLMLNRVTAIVGINKWPIRVGGDTAAGGDENCVIAGRGNKLLLEEFNREVDTTITADWFDHIFGEKLKLQKNHEYIFMDDGNVGHSITDMLVRKGWINIRRVLNQSAAIQKKRFGNRGAEMWTQVKRILEERYYDVTQLSEKCRTQLANRYYKQQQTQGRITLESKKDAKAHGRPSPDRADAFILHLTGLTIDDFINADKPSDAERVEAAKTKLTMAEVPEWFDNNRFSAFDQVNPNKTNKSANGSLSVVLNRHSNKKSPLNKYGYNN